MRYEIMRLMQFLFSLSLLVGAFGGGLLLGWYRWGVSARTQAAATRRSERWPTARGSTTSGTARQATASSTLFSPVYDDEFDDAYGFERDLFDADTIDLRAVSSRVRGELTVGNDDESSTDDAAD